MGEIGQASTDNRIKINISPGKNNFKGSTSCSYGTGKSGNRKIAKEQDWKQCKY